MALDPIHYKRRWYYVLWSTLLVLSAGALFLWERPARTDLASLQVVLAIKGAPEGSRLQAWAGPWRRWPGSAWSGQGAFADMPLPVSGSATLPLLRLSIARRRWTAGYIPRETWELVMVKVVPPSGAPRYYPLPCSSDIRLGLLKPKRRLTIAIDTSWSNLKVDANPPIRVP